MMSRSPVHDDEMRNIHNQKRECKIDDRMQTGRKERHSDTNWKHFDPSCSFHSLQGLCACESRHATKDLHPELGKTTEHDAVKMKTARQTKAGQDPGHISDKYDRTMRRFSVRQTRANKVHTTALLVG